MKTEILVITDRSGSMASIAPDVIGGYNTFIKEQQAVPGEAKVTFTQFDDKYEVVYAGVPIADVKPLDSETFKPRGYTALHDAIGRTLNEQGKRISDEKWADLVIVQIITDGGENASREYSAVRVKEMVEHAEKNGWKFIYMGANQDSFAVTHGLGMSKAVVANYAPNAAGTMSAYRMSSLTASSLRSANWP